VSDDQSTPAAGAVPSLPTETPHDHPTPTRASIFTNSILFHLTNLMRIEARQASHPKALLSQSHYRSLSRAYRFAQRWHAAIHLPACAGGLTDQPHPSLPRTRREAERWLISLAQRICRICERHMAAAHDMLVNDPERTGSNTDLSFDSLRDRVSHLDGFLTIAHRNQGTHTPSSANSAFATPSSANEFATMAPTTPQSAAFFPNNRQGSSRVTEAARAGGAPNNTPSPVPAAAPSGRPGTRSAKAMGQQPDTGPSDYYRQSILAMIDELSNAPAPTTA
jgi:hypothetical protein